MRGDSRYHPRDGFFNRERLCFHYLEWNVDNQPAMVLLHGIGDSACVWGDFAERTSGLFRIIALDQRGHGFSDHPSPPAYTCRDYVGDLEALIDSLSLEGIILMGHSMGALHATFYASERPEKVVALIHADIEPHPPPWNRRYLQGLYENLPPYYSDAEEYVRFLRKNSPYADNRLLIRHTASDLYQLEDGTYRCRYDREVLAHFDLYDLRPKLGNITCPTLVIRGAESRVMGRKEAMAMAAAIPRGRFAEVPRATHPLHTDNPEGFAQVVLEFLFNLQRDGR